MKSCASSLKNKKTKRGIFSFWFSLFLGLLDQSRGKNCNRDMFCWVSNDPNQETIRDGGPGIYHSLKRFFHDYNLEKLRQASFKFMFFHL